MTDYDDLFSDDSSSGEDIQNTYDEAINTAELPIERGKINFIDARLVGTLDNCKVSGRYATHVIAAVAKALGHDLSRLVINRESYRKCRQQYREQIAQQIKDDFHGNVN